MEDDERSGGEPRHQAPWLFRGRGLSRVLALSDGVFAFALTLLVLSLALPVGTSGAGVRSYLAGPAFLPSLYAYLISFFVISSWWQGHHLVFGYLRSYNRMLFRLNMLFLICIAIIPFATTVLNDAGGDTVGVEVFASIQILTGLALCGLWRYASGSSHLTIAGLPASWRRYVTFSTLAPPVVFAVSVPFAFFPISVSARVLPGIWVSEAMWLAIFVIPLFVRKSIAADPAPRSGQRDQPE